MKTQDRLSAAYDRAHVVEVDRATKLVFLSDQHRGDGSNADEFAKNKVIVTHALTHYLDEGFTLVELGDTEDLWEFPHVRHIVRAHGIVYGRLREFHALGRYLRLFGNHDAQLADLRYVRQNLFQAQNPQTGELEPLLPGLEVHESLLLRDRDTGQEVLVVHGHQGDFSNDQNWRFTMWTYRAFWKWLHAFGIHSPSSPIRNTFKRHKVERNYVKWIREHGIALICGHTHRAKFPASDETPYFNSGSCTFNAYVTGLEIVNGEISLVRWRVESDANGYLHVVRWVLAGPRPLSDYDRLRRPGLSADEETDRHEAIRARSRRVPPRKDAGVPTGPVSP
ncbi:MAG TPA: hypothetical protein PKX10_01430 [Propioniciclava tarda]|nr:hypothetical protein [Propioniciclava tarda]HQD59819.1 hypothetical protein [Propioniciclava tarda]